MATDATCTYKHLRYLKPDYCSTFSAFLSHSIRREAGPRKLDLSHVLTEGNDGITGGSHVPTVNGGQARGWWVGRSDGRTDDLYPYMET